MEVLVDVFEALVGNVGINLGGSYAGVAKELLHAAQVGTVTQEVGGKQMAELVGSYALADAGFPRIEVH